jgi:alpha-L-fucosidase 2
LGNGLDAVLIGYNGSMVPDKVGVDRCVWYKSDRYYPEERLVKVAGRFPIEKPLEHAQGSGWYEIAPLGHTWYEVIHQGQLQEIKASEQRFDPRRGLLFTRLDFGPVQAEVLTFLYALESLLIEHYEFNAEVEFTAWMAPGVWVEDGWDTDPFKAVRLETGAARVWYDLGETQGNLFLHIDPSNGEPFFHGNACGQKASGRRFTKYFSILDNRQGDFERAAFQRLLAPGYDQLLSWHIHFWEGYASRSQVIVPDEQFQRLYDASLYHFKAAQNRLTGGLPVNNLRRTWSSHIFWDSYYLQRALLEANHVEESRQACSFLEKTVGQARRHAREEFGCDGLKWDWEVTHDARKAYGTLLHMKYQVHNNGSYANELWQHYLFTRDLSYLDEVYPILEGLATFFMGCIVEKTSRGWEIGSLVGVNESPIKVKNEGMSLAATIVILERCAGAAQLLGRESGFTRQCQEAAAGLRKIVDLLFNGHYFVSAEGSGNANTASTGVIYPLSVIPFEDPRSIQTAQAFLKDDSRGHRNGHDYNFPWHWGVLATILACQHDGNAAWTAIQTTRPTICSFGGMTEVMEDGCWNMQYFLTAQAAVVTALHSLMLQSREEMVEIFPAIPPEWQTCSFERLLASGLELSATYENGRIRGEARNVAPAALERTLKVGNTVTHVQLKQGETCAIQTPQ